MHVPSPAASALLRHSKCQAPHAAEECLPTFPTSSSRAGWQAKEESSPAMVLTACCSGAVTGCVMLLSGGKGGYVRSSLSWRLLLFAQPLNCQKGEQRGRSSKAALNFSPYPPRPLAFAGAQQ